jgi:hypothetical protein
MTNSKVISISENASPLRVRLKMQRHHFSLLIPGKTSPCSIYIYFKGKYIEVVKREGMVTLDFVAKMYNVENYFFYILDSEAHLFDYWVKQRHSYESLPHFNIDENKKKIEFRVSNYIRYAVESFGFSEDNITTRKFFKQAEAKIREVCCHSSLQWYFEQDFEKDIKNHTGRALFSTLLFVESQPDLVATIDPFSFIKGIILHQLTNSPTKYKEVDLGKETINYLVEKGIVVHGSVSSIIKNQNELYNGKGGPKGLKGQQIPIPSQVFIFFDYLDHYRLTTQGVTRNTALGEMKKRFSNESEQFNPNLLKKFLGFLEIIKLLS